MGPMGRMGLGRALAFAIPAFMPCLSACAAHAKGEARLQAKSETGQSRGADFEASVDEGVGTDPSGSGSSGSGSSDPGSSGPGSGASVVPADLGMGRLDIPTAQLRPQYSGIVHDLSLKSGSAHHASCNCLSVSYGRADDPQFDWKADTLRKDDPTAFVIAIRGESPCDSASSAHPAAQASIAGIAYEGNNVILTIEPARGGRPIVRGVMAMYPTARGAISVREAASRGKRKSSLCTIAIE